VSLRRGDEDFAGAVVSLGLLGVVVRLTLDVLPAAEIRQYVYDDLPDLEHVTDLLDGGYSVSLFTDWRGPGATTVWRKVTEPVEPGPWFGARPADGPRHPVAGVPPETCTLQGGVPGPWHERLPHFRLDHTPSVGDELQSEFLVPRERAGEALAALGSLGDRIADVLLITEIRAVAADDLWLSMAYGRDSVALHFTWKPDAAAVAPVLDAVEDALAPYDPRPHWGKVSRFDPAQLDRTYPRLPDFRALVARWDPTGTFRNPLTDRALSLRQNSSAL
jgi:alditol oxidase